ncbi:MAG: TonB C-terminal domain-containing protein [Candidatus Aminicenantes bacterium]|nr:TonB C-terminal domain-containing protein [Candidatus Aminicenantes bacterium]
MGNSEDRKDTAICRLAAVVSLVIHGLLLFCLFYFRSTIDTNPFGQEVRHVFIAPGDPLIFREGTEIRENEVVPSEPPPTTPVAAPVASPSFDSIGRKPNSSDVSSAESFPSSASFRLSLPADYLSRLPEGYEFDLIRRPETVVPGGSDSKETRDVSGFDPARYLGGGLGRPVSGIHVSTRLPVQTSSSVSSAVRADILIPWAGRVVEKVQMNWTPPVSESDLTGFTVRIALEVGSGAQVLSLHILDPSLLPELDRSALDAVRLSFPLPELPRDFPDEPFSFILVFSVHE